MNRGYDLLLAWLSSRERPPSDSTVAEACRYLSAREKGHESSVTPGGWPHLLDPLYRLGHIERSATGGWRVLTPTLIWHPRLAGEGTGHLYGARVPALWKGLEQALGKQLETTEPSAGPALWSVAGCAAEIFQKLESLGFRSQVERGEELLAGLPRVSMALRQLETESAPPVLRGGRWERFAPERDGSWPWRPLTDTTTPEPGVYRPVEQRGQAWLRVARSRGRTEVSLLHAFELRAIALWRELVQCGVVRLVHDNARKSLWVNRFRWSPLPILLDRGLSLASGLRPEIIEREKASFWRYRGVSRDRARLFARALELRLETSR